MNEDGSKPVASLPAGDGPGAGAPVHDRDPIARHRAVFFNPLLVLMCAWVLAGSQSLLAQTVFSDTEFDVMNDWTNVGPYVTPEGAMNAAFETEQALSGGNPGAFVEVTLTRSTVSEGETYTWVAMINDTFSWDPSEDADGPIGKIDFRMDNQGGGAWTIAVRQGEHTWFAQYRRIINYEQGWATLEIDCLQESDFVPLPGAEFVIGEQPDHPDFSADGEPLYFGIGLGLSCPATSNCTTIVPVTFDVDNLHITVNRPFKINAGLNDAWYDPATAGQGFFNVVYPELEIIFLSWFTYEVERPAEDIVAILGEAGHRWLTAQGGYEGGKAVLDIVLKQGGVFDSDDPLPGPGEIIGTMTIEWCDCGKGVLTYDIPSLELSGTIPIERVALDNIALCQALWE
jgi:hypothetical protein